MTQSDVRSRGWAIVACVDRAGGLGRGGRLPWHCPEDLAFFKALTTTTQRAGARNAVVMGRRTWESLPEKVRPLPQRINIVMSRRTFALPSGVLRVGGWDQIHQHVDANAMCERVFIIGGAAVFAEALLNQRVEELWLTRLHDEYDCDVFFPRIPSTFKLVKKTAVQGSLVPFHQEHYLRIES